MFTKGLDSIAELGVEAVCRIEVTAPRGARGENPLAFCDGLSPVHRASEQPSLRKAHDTSPRDDEMVENLNIDQRKRRLERAGENLVGVARLRDS